MAKLTNFRQRFDVVEIKAAFSNTVLIPAAEQFDDFLTI
jgi:hypothetical protein